MSKFIINDYHSVKLENDETVIYVDSERFSICKFLLLNIPVDEIASFDEI